MIVEAIDKILSLAGPKTIVIPGADGIKRVYGEKGQITPPIMNPLVVKTLSSFCDFINSGREEEVCKAEYILISKHDTVEAFSTVDPETMSRRYIITAVAPKINFNFGYAYDAETFIIGLQAYFAPSEQRDQLLAAVSGVKLTKGLTIRDNGISQTVQTEAGVSRVENLTIANPIILRPFRTFLEVDQPESEFVFRMKETSEKAGVAFQLIEADGGAWKIKAIQSILSYLDENCAAEGVLLLA